MRLSARSIAAMGAVALALANLGRLPAGALGGRGAPLVVADLVVVVAWCMIAAAVLSRRVLPTIDDVISAVALFVAVAVVSTLGAVARYHLGLTESVGVLAFLLRWIGYFGWYPLVVWCLTPGESRRAWSYVEVALLAIALFGLLQSAFLPGFAQMVNAGGDAREWDVQGRRLVSTLLDPNFAGILVVIALLCRLARILEGLEERWVALVVLAAALLVTVSRSSILAFVVGLIVLSLVRGLRLRLLRVFLVGAVLLLPFLSVLIAFASGFNKLQFDASAAMRLVPWAQGVKLLSEHPLLGIGFNALTPAQEQHGWLPALGAEGSLDGGLLFIGAMTGLLGLGAYLLLLFRVWRRARLVARDDSLLPDERAHATATMAVLFAVVVHSFFVNSLLLPFVMQVLWVMWGRLAQIARARRRRLVQTAVALSVAAVAAGCVEPCAGVENCSTSPHIVLTGSIVDHLTGKPVAGARIDGTFTLASGSPATTSAITDSEGLWTLDVEATGAGPVSAQLAVTSPGKPTYHVPPFTPRLVTTGGDAEAFTPWTDVPYVRYQATILYHGQPLGSASVQFVRVGGVSATPVASGTTNVAGIFELDVTGADVGSVTGTLSVVSSPLPSPSQFAGFTIPLDYHFGIPGVATTLTVGGQIAYGGETIFLGTGETVGGIGVSFVRTGGIPTAEPSVSTTSGANGFFRIDLTPEGEGDVIGDLTLSPPSGAPAIYHGVHLATYDSTSIRFSGVWGFGQAWAWSVEIWRNDSLTPEPNLPAEFRRTGGLAITPDSIVKLKTDSHGRIDLRAAVNDTGTVDGEITVYPAVGPPRTISNLQLRTNPDDSLHFAGVFGFGPSLRYVGEVLTQAGAPVVGAQVEWQQTSGVPATPTVLDGVVGADGRFPLTLYPSTDGDVVGRVIVRPPAPWAAGTVFTFENLNISSFESGELRLAVTYRLPPP